MKALVGAFNQEKALVGAFSVIVQPVVEPMEHYTALVVMVMMMMMTLTMRSPSKSSVASVSSRPGTPNREDHTFTPTFISMIKPLQKQELKHLLKLPRDLRSD